MQILLISIIIVLLCAVGLGFNIIFRKNGKFPETEVSSNKDMRKLGIRCAKEEEMKLWGKKKGKPSCEDASCAECASCQFYNSK